MSPKQDDPQREPRLCMANACFKHAVLAIHVSELDEDLKEPSLGIMR